MAVTVRPYRPPFPSLGVYASGRTTPEGLAEAKAEAARPVLAGNCGRCGGELVVLIPGALYVFGVPNLAHVDRSTGCPAGLATSKPRKGKRR